MVEVVLGFMVLLGLGLASLATLASGGIHVGWALVFQVAGLALAAWSLRLFWMRDSVAATKLVMFCCVMPGLIAGLWAANTQQGRGAALGVAVACAIGAGACALALWREASRPRCCPTSSSTSRIGAGSWRSTGESN